jgi:hypothetical protein
MEQILRAVFLEENAGPRILVIVLVPRSRLQSGSSQSSAILLED